ncbi:MAG: peptidyl-prolyl cis-trans isomerase [Verrucomicrobiota bacterium]
MNSLHFSVLAFLLIGSAGCSRRTVPPPATNILAQIGDEVITTEQFQAAMTRRRVPDQPEAKHALLNEMIRYRTLVQEARRRGLDRDPEVIEAYESMLAGKVREMDAEAQKGRLIVTAQEVEAYYQAHAQEFALPARIRVAMIFVEATRNFTEAARTERRASLEAAREKALNLDRQKAGFGALAAEYSYDQATKFRGGDIGYVVQGTSDPNLGEEVLAAAFALKAPGEVSEIIATERGFFLLRLMEHQPGSIRALSQMERPIRQRLVQQKQRELEREPARSQGAAASVVIHEERLAALSVAIKPAKSEMPPPMPAN